jgi:tRNA A-37 threonylcarbamoyl transferase component Bud32
MTFNAKVGAGMRAAPPGYELVDELGQGATGTVHLARQVAQDREVVIKRMVGGASSQDPEAVLRFERQARLLTRLDHPGIVRVHEVVRMGADLLVVMDHVPGGDLRELLAAVSPPKDVAARILSEIAAALDHAHERGVLHGDLQPANVLLDEGGAVRVSDFGLVTLLERQAASRAGRPGAVESLAYMAPELARGERVDRRADVYSLGAIAYEMLVGRLPFPIHPEDPYATVRAQMEEPPPRPGELVPGFPPLLEAALLWALEKPPERRPATAGELAASLRDGLTLSPTIGAYVRPARKPAVEGAAPAAPTGDRAAAPARRRLVAAGLAAGAIVAAVAIVAGVRLATAPPAQPPPPPLAVTGIAAAAAPDGGAGRCPAATITVRATVTTNGSPGTIAYRWLRPDGGPPATGRVVLRRGQRSAIVELPLTYSGSVPAQGVAALHVLSPAAVYSEPLTITYACP